MQANGIMKTNRQDNTEIILRIKAHLYPKFNKRFVSITAILNKLSHQEEGFLLQKHLSILNVSKKVQLKFTANIALK